MAPITVAVAGGTGRLGQLIVEELLAPQYFLSKVAKVLVTTRNPESDSSKKIKALGAELFGGPVSADVFKGVDVVVNTIGGFPLEIESLNPVAKAAAEAGAKVYLGNDYGSDYHSFGPGFDVHPIYQTKGDADIYARKVGGTKTKVVGIHTGLFTEAVFPMGPRVGWNYPTGEYTAVASASAPTTLTTMGDIAKAVARLVVLAAEYPSSVPDQVRISGDAVTTEQVAEIFKNEGAKTPEIKIVTETEFLAGQTLKDIHFLAYMQLCNGTSRADQSKDNHNELVNPGESIWKWKKLAEVVHEKKGVMW